MIRNVHEHVINAPIEFLGTLPDGLGQEDDRLWLSQSWTPMVLDQPLAVKAGGGYDVICYHANEYEPNRRVWFTLRPRTEIIGVHELGLDTLDDEHTRARYVPTGRARGVMRLMFSATAEPLRDAVVGDLPDSAEREMTGLVAWLVPWSPQVRVLRRLTDDRQPLNAGWTDGEFCQKPAQSQGDRLTERRQPPQIRRTP